MKYDNFFFAGPCQPFWFRIKRCCGSGVFIPDPDFCHPGSRIQKRQQKRGDHKIVNYFIYELVKKTIWANLQRIIELFILKSVDTLSKIWVWDPGSGKNLFRISDPRGQRGTGSRIRKTGTKATKTESINLMPNLPFKWNALHHKVLTGTYVEYRT
jgi:hypothetical protein